MPGHARKNNASRRGKNPFIDRPHPRGMAGKLAWNRGQRYEETYDPETARRLHESAARGGLVKRTVSAEVEANRRQKLAPIARARRLGGYERGSGRGKKGWYRGHWCDSTYELAFVIYALDQGMWFERNWQAFPYTFEGRTRTWIPDFRLKDGTYLEM